MPVLDGKLRNSSIAASNPPADPPMPTIGQVEFFFGALTDADRRPRLGRANFLLLDFLRESWVRLWGVRFEAMGGFLG
jgi:hypothetical protein